MIKLRKDKKEKRKWFLKFTEMDDATFELNLLASSLTNKFETVQLFMEEMCRLLPNFETWYYELFMEYRNSNFNSEIILNNCDKIISFSEEYIASKNIDFNKFVDLSKISKTSIIFYAEDIYAIALASTCLKIYSIFNLDKEMKIPENINKIIYHKFIQKCVDNKTTDKIFDLIRTRTYRSSINDRYLWDLIKMSVLETPETHSMTLFNFIMINLISMLSVEANPIYFIISIANDSIRWMMCTVYKEKIIYNEEFSNIDDIYGSSLSKESFHLYACNDVITRAAKIGMKMLETQNIDEIIFEKQSLEEENRIKNDTNIAKKIEELSKKINVDQENFTKLRDRLDTIKLLSPVMRFLILPIASQVLEVPYKYLLTTPPRHIALIGALLHEMMKDNLVVKYPILMEFLISCQKDTSFVTTKSSYQIRNIEHIINDSEHLFGFYSKSFKYDIISPICGVLCASKRNLVSLIDGEKLSKVKYQELETDAIDFYLNLYSGRLDKEFSILRDKLDEYL